MKSNDAFPESVAHTSLLIPEENKKEPVERLWDFFFVLALFTVIGIVILYASDAVRSNEQFFFQNTIWPKIIHF